MKHLEFSFLLFVFAFQTMLANDKYYDVAINGIYYRLNKDSKEATVVMGCTEEEEPDPFGVVHGPIRVANYKGDVVIPESFVHDGTTFIVTSIEGQVRDHDIFYFYGAFEGCSELTSITIPKSIKSIGHQAFAGCTSLKSVYISDLCAWCNLDFDLYDRKGNYFPNANPLYFAHTLYLNGNKITDLTTPDDIIIIKEGSFIGCDISTVTFHKNITNIGYKAFDDCNYLNDVYCYSPEIETMWSFIAHESKTLHIRKRYSNNYYFFGSEWSKFGERDYIEGVDFLLKYYVDDACYMDAIMEVGEAIEPEPTPSKEGYTFSGWSDIPETMPDHDVTITGTFSPNTYKLTYYVDGELYKVFDMKYDESVESESYPEKEGFTFSGWSKIPATMPAQDVNVYGTFKINKYDLLFLVDDIEYAYFIIEYGSATKIPENNPQKENYEFIGWSEIPATMPARNISSTASFNKVSTDIDGVKYKFVGEDAYVTGNNKSGAVKVLSSFEEDGKTYTVTVIDKNAFGNNASISFVEVPNTVAAINDRAFFGCRNLTNIELGNSVRVVGERAFANIDRLIDVVCYAEEVPDADRTSFENSYIDYVTLHVPAESVDKYKAVGPWKDFKEIVAIEGTEPISVETCVMPTILFQNGKLEFESGTDGAECHYEIKVEDAKEGVGSEVTLSSAYEISVFASKEGYNDSEKNTATLYWINVEPISTGVIENEMRVNTNAILVQNTGGTIAISGVADGDNVLIYNISGQLIAQGQASGNNVVIGTNISSGDICIIKIGDKSVKYLLK